MASLDRGPIRAYKCVVELTIHEISAPGVRLANKDELYLNICLLGQQRRTRLVQPQFPLKFSDTLIFEKTFKLCCDPFDAVDFLADSHVLIELVQLGRCGGMHNSPVLAWYELNAQDFLYPSPDIRLNYFGSQRDLFMARSVDFPGAISPQVLFSASMRVDETQTPSLDILREFENRFVSDPLIELNKRQNAKSKRKSQRRNTNSASSTRAAAAASAVGATKPSASTRHPRPLEHHTVSSAIKADYTLPTVRAKLSELNNSVRRACVVRTAPGAQAHQQSARRQARSERPFVVRKVEDSLILRKPELHDVLHDDLVLTKKSVRRMRRHNHTRSSSSNSNSGSSRRQMRRATSSSSGSGSCCDYGCNCACGCGASATRCRVDQRRSRSLNGSLCGSRSGSVSSLSASTRRFRSDSCGDASGGELGNSSAVFHIVDQRQQQQQRTAHSHSPRRSPGRSLNMNLALENGCRQRSRSRNSSTASAVHNHTYDILPDPACAGQCAVASNCEVCNNCHSRAQHTPLCNQINKSGELEESAYARYYPWLHKRTERLRDLEEELYWLKVRSKYLNHH